MVPNVPADATRNDTELTGCTTRGEVDKGGAEQAAAPQDHGHSNGAQLRSTSNSWRRRRAAPSIANPRSELHLTTMWLTTIPTRVIDVFAVVCNSVVFVTNVDPLGAGPPGIIRRRYHAMGWTICVFIIHANALLRIPRGRQFSSHSPRWS
jgi:hypothetical protein